MHRVNILLSDAAWRELQEIPKGERSRLVSQAIAQLAETRRRADAVAKMAELRALLPAVEEGTIVKWVREERKRD